MEMHGTSPYIKACIAAWLQCETLLESLTNQGISFSARTQQVLEECAQMCLATGHAVKNNLPRRYELALLCVGLCEECAEICERYKNKLFDACAQACRQCSAVITPIASAAV
jgi:hypothetical protein